MRRKASLRELLERDEIVVAPGCYDPLSARIVEGLGFDAVYLGGYATGAHWCITEPLTSLAEIVGLARSVANAVNIPLIVDADAGFGDPIHVVRTVREFERAGAAAIHIEDQVYPKRAHYHKYSVKEPTRTVHTIPMEQMVEKIKVAVESRDSEDFLIIARTDKIASHNVDEAIRCANAYTKAGADMIMCFPETIEDIKKILNSVNNRFVHLNGEARPRPYLTPQEAQKLGFKLLIYALTATYVSVNAIYKVYERLKRTGDTGLNTNEMVKEMDKTKQLVENLIDLPKFYEIEERVGLK
jgi:methylisocitrate lyase